MSWKKVNLTVIIPLRLGFKFANFNLFHKDNEFNWNLLHNISWDSFVSKQLYLKGTPWLQSQNSAAYVAAALSFLLLDFEKIFAYFLHVSDVVVSLCYSSKANNDHCAFLHASKCLAKMFVIQTTPFNLSGGVFNNWTGWKNMILLFGCRWRREKEILLWKEKSSLLSVRIRGSQKEKEKESKRQNKAYLLISSIARLRSFQLSLQSFVSFCCAPCLLFLPTNLFSFPGLSIVVEQ